MLNKKMILIIALAFSISSSFAQVLKKSGNEYVLTKDNVSLFQLVQDYSSIAGINLIIDASLKDETLVVAGKKSFDMDELERYISFHLFINKMALLKNNDKDYYELISARDVRYKDLAVYENKDEIPNNHNYIRFIYKLKHVEGSDLARNVRPFMSRYGRIIDIESAKQIIISDVAKNVKRIIQIYEMVDVPETVKTQKELQQLNDKFQKMSSYKGDIWDNIDKYQVYFMILFSSISLVIGFILRGYLIRKIEGGL